MSAVLPPNIRRNLPDSLGSPVLPAAQRGQQVVPVRPAAATQIRPWPNVPVNNSSEATMILPRNPKRVCAVLMNYASATSQVLVGGGGANLPESGVGVLRAKGLPLKNECSVVLDTTDEIWVISAAGSAISYIFGYELLAEEDQP